jgi:hypothetical protein
MSVPGVVGDDGAFDEFVAGEVAVIADEHSGR